MSHSNRKWHYFRGAGPLRTKGFEKELVDGMGTAFRLTRHDGLTIRLAHEPIFCGKDNNSIYSFTTSQMPDILLEAIFPGGRRIRWIFDAKYRISPEEADYDRIPDDAINQMHRYRDALIHLEAADDGITEKSRPVVGAFVLYPGFFNGEEGVNPYEAGIEAVGIGGFPLLPGRANRWLKAFLKEKFGDLSKESSTDRVLEPDDHLMHDSVRIAPTGLSLKRYDDLALVASLGSVAGRTQDYVDRFKDGTAGWYHMPVSTSEKKKYSRTVMREIRYCAVAVHPTGASGRLIEYLYDVVSVKLVKRCELTVEQAGSLDSMNQNEYWLLKLGASKKIPLPIGVGGARTFRSHLVGAYDLLKAKKWSDLSERYAAFMEKSDAVI
jgi:hypothetical protein